MFANGGCPPVLSDQQQTITRTIKGTLAPIGLHIDGLWGWAQRLLNELAYRFGEFRGGFLFQLEAMLGLDQEKTASRCFDQNIINRLWGFTKKPPLTS